MSDHGKRRLRSRSFGSGALLSISGPVSIEVFLFFRATWIHREEEHTLKSEALTLDWRRVNTRERERERAEPVDAKRYFHASFIWNRRFEPRLGSRHQVRWPTSIDRNCTIDIRFFVFFLPFSKETFVWNILFESDALSRETMFVEMSEMFVTNETANFYESYFNSYFWENNQSRVFVKLKLKLKFECIRIDYNRNSFFLFLNYRTRWNAILWEEDWTPCIFHFDSLAMHSLITIINCEVMFQNILKNDLSKMEDGKRKTKVFNISL